MRKVEVDLIFLRRLWKSWHITEDIREPVSIKYTPAFSETATEQGTSTAPDLMFSTYQSIIVNFEYTT